MLVYLRIHSHNFLWSSLTRNPNMMMKSGVRILAAQALRARFLLQLWHRNIVSMLGFLSHLPAFLSRFFECDAY